MPKESANTTYCKQHPPLLNLFLEFSLFLIASNTLNVIPSIGVVGFVVGNVEFPHASEVARATVVVVEEKGGLMPSAQTISGEIETGAYSPGTTCNQQFGYYQGH